MQTLVNLDFGHEPEKTEIQVRKRIGVWDLRKKEYPEKDTCQ